MEALGEKTMAVLYREQEGDEMAGGEVDEEQFDDATLATINTLCSVAMQLSWTRRSISSCTMRARGRRPHCVAGGEMEGMKLTTRVNGTACDNASSRVAIHHQKKPWG
jgi:hypothetical protein